MGRAANSSRGMDEDIVNTVCYMYYGGGSKGAVDK